MTKTYDALIVGARCAGAASAMLMARAGLDVLVVDRAEAGRDTMSSHTMTRGAALQLDRWGLLPQIMAGGAPAIQRTIFQFGDDVVDLAIRPLTSGPGMLAPRRHRLDALLAGAAREAGAEIRFGTSFQDVVRDAAGRVTGAVLTDPTGCDVTVRAGVVVGADGIRSTVARRVGSAVLAQEDHCLGHVYGYYEGLGLADNHGYFAPGLSIGATPTDEGRTVVIVSAPPAQLRAAVAEAGPAAALERLAGQVDAGFAARLAWGRLVERPVVFGGVPGFRRASAGPGWALAGDAACFKDPITSHGMTDAYRDAELVAQAVLAGGDAALADYARARNAVSADFFALTAEMARFDQPMPVLREQFGRLSAVMKAEQAWMADRFGPVAVAA